MEIMTGKDPEELKRILEVLDENTRLDSILKNRQRVSITGIQEKGKLRNWQLGISLDQYNASKPHLKGRTYNSFFDAIEHLNQTGTFMPDCSVLCYCSTEPTRTWDGKIVSYWYDLESGIPYTVDAVTHQPVFEIKKLALDESDYQVMMKSKLAFYCSTTEDIYPILDTAFPSVGKLLDSASSFQKLDEHPLGSALLLAEKLSGIIGIQFLYRERSENVKPILSMMGGKYTYCPQKDFFSEALSEVAKHAVYDVNRWSVSDELTTLEVVIKQPNPDYELGFLMKTSDLSGASLSVTAFAKVGKGRLFLARNKSYHSKQFQLNGGTKALFDGLWEAMDAFESEFNALDSLQCRYDVSLIKPILSLIGKKRAALVEPIGEGIYNAKELFRLIISRTFQTLPTKQAGVLEQLYMQLLHDVTNKSGEM